MKITRIGKDRNQDIPVDTIELEVRSRKYRIDESRDGSLIINKIESDTEKESSITVMPKAANEIAVK